MVASFLKIRYPADLLEQRYAAMTPLQRILLAQIAAGATEMTGAANITRVIEQLGTGTRATQRGTPIGGHRDRQRSLRHGTLLSDQLFAFHSEPADALRVCRL
jgi:hypothetical protein